MKVCLNLWRAIASCNSLYLCVFWLLVQHKVLNIRCLVRPIMCRRVYKLLNLWVHLECFGYGNCQKTRRLIAKRLDCANNIACLLIKLKQNIRHHKCYNTVQELSWILSGCLGFTSIRHSHERLKYY